MASKTYLNQWNRSMSFSKRTDEKDTYGNHKFPPVASQKTILDSLFGKRNPNHLYSWYGSNKLCFLQTPSKNEQNQKTKKHKNQKTCQDQRSNCFIQRNSIPFHQKPIPPRRCWCSPSFGASKCPNDPAWRELKQWGLWGCPLRLQSPWGSSHLLQTYSPCYPKSVEQLCF